MKQKSNQIFTFQKIVPITVILFSFFLSGVLNAEVAVERWGKLKTSSHKGMTLIRLADKTSILRFDLSELKKGTKIFRASLRVKATGSPSKPILIYPLKAGSTDKKPLPDNEPLKLEPPRYNSFDMTKIVSEWVSGSRPNKGLLIKRFEGWRPNETELEITYEGKAKKPPPQVKGLKVFHRKGQTFLTWTEIDKLINIEKVKQKSFAQALKKGSPRGEVLYRVYSHDKPITAGNIGNAKRVDETGVLSGYDKAIRQRNCIGEIDQGYDPNTIVPRFCIEIIPYTPFKATHTFTYMKRNFPEWTGKQLPLYTGLYVHKSPKAGKKYYAVVSSVNGVENTRDVSSANSLKKPIEEIVGAGEPVLYRRMDQSSGRGRGRKNQESQYYVYWTAPPTSNIPNSPCHILVGISEPDSKAAMSTSIKTGRFEGMYWGELVCGLGRDRFRKRPHITLAVQEDVSYTGGLGYHSAFRTLQAYSQGYVEMYIVRRLDMALRWAKTRWKLDPGRVSCKNAFWAIHLPDLVTYCHLGQYQSIMSYLRSPYGRALPTKFGPFEIAKTKNGENAWELLDVEKVVRKNPAKETAFMWCPGGKGTGHEMETGYLQNPRVWRALMDTKHPFVAAWGGCIRNMFGDPPKRFEEMTYDKNVPAFANCSLDSNPGSGSINDGDFSGQINGYLWWDPKSGTDEKDKWTLDIFLVEDSPEKECTTDITPRRLKNFKAKPGEKFKWTNTNIGDSREIQSGTVTADKSGLVTIPKVIISKGKNRILLKK